MSILLLTIQPVVLNFNTPLGMLSGALLNTKVVELIIETTVCPFVNPLPDTVIPTLIPAVEETTNVSPELPTGL